VDGWRDGWGDGAMGSWSLMEAGRGGDRGAGRAGSESVRGSSVQVGVAAPQAPAL
jgi:hypothetical protein